MLRTSKLLSVRTMRKELELAGTSIVMEDVADSDTSTVQLFWPYCTKAIANDI